MNTRAPVCWRWDMWLDSKIPSSKVAPDGFSAYKMGSRTRSRDRWWGGAVSLLIRGDWCLSESVVVRERLCTPDIELLCGSLCIFYLPCEFPLFFFTVVNIHPKQTLLKHQWQYFTSQKLESFSNAPNFFLGDFNNCSLRNTLRTYYWYESCNTRKNRHHYGTPGMLWVYLMGSF